MVSKGCVIHSFCHSFRDRLREVSCPTEIIDQLGGWASIGIGKKYGNGYQLKELNASYHRRQLSLKNPKDSDF